VQSTCRSESTGRDACAAQSSQGMDLTDNERDLLLAGLFELTITHAEDDEKRERCKALAEKLGGDADAVFFRAE
jgi:hypothetical protein